MTRLDQQHREVAHETRQRSSGLLWLIVAAVAGLVYVAALVMLRDGQVGISTTGIALDAGIYVAMIVTRLVVHGIPARLGSLAAEFIAMSLVSLVCLVVLAMIAPIS